MYKLGKILAAFTLLLVFLTSCAPNSKTKQQVTTPYYEMLEDVVFKNNDKAVEKSFILKKGQTVIGQLNDANELEIYFDRVIFTTTSQKIKGVTEMQVQAMVAMISIDQIEIALNADIINETGTVIAHTQTNIPAIHYIREHQLNGINYYELNLAGVLAYVKIDDAVLLPAE